MLEKNAAWQEETRRLIFMLLSAVKNELRFMMPNDLL